MVLSNVLRVRKRMRFFTQIFKNLRPGFVMYITTDVHVKTSFSIMQISGTCIAYVTVKLMLNFSANILSNCVGLQVLLEY